MLKKIHNRIFGDNLDVREQIFRVILLAGATIALVGLVESMFITDMGMATVTVFIELAAVIVALFLTFKYRRVEMASVLLGIVICGKVFPDMFFLCGGIEGGATIWFVLGFFYVFIMFSGKRLLFFVILAIAVDAVTYLLAYMKPSLITPIATRAGVYTDSLFAVITVGVIVGAILRFQMRLNEKERSIAVAQKEEIERISNSKNQFFANMSHEIRTPINTIIGLNEMILRGNADDETREYAETIQNASKMLLSLVNDILDLSQMESNEMQIMPIEYETKAMFREMVDMIEVRVQEKELELWVDIDEMLPSVMVGDERRIKQILLNILTNAVKYTPKGSVTLSAHGDMTEEGEIILKISVSDTGIGIRKEDLENLYDAFKRVDERRNRNVEGTGLGLAITKQLVDMMGGEITVDSIYTKGSTFTVTVRQKVADATPIGNIGIFDKHMRSAREGYQASFEAPEARLLVVEDNPMNAMVVTRLLAETKVQIDVAENGEVCLEHTRQKFYHVILMDYMMPGMDGGEVLRAIRRQENGLCRDSAIIVLTADALMGSKSKYTEQGFDGYLEKPILTTKLESEILKFLPDDILEYRMEAEDEAERQNQIRQFARRKRKKIYITTDCVCDLPEELLEKYDIASMYFYIKTESGRFADTREIDSDSLAYYMTGDDDIIYSDSVSVEEFEEFFAEVLTQAENVIHISLAEHAGKGYGVAQMAAQGFDHVHVIDSGHISGGEGLVVLYAVKMAQEGYSVTEICEAVERFKQRVETKFLMPTSRIFYMKGYTDPITAKLCDILNVHPVLKMHQSKLIIVGTRRGKLEGAWKRYIRFHLRRKRRIDDSVVIITYVGCTVKQQEMIREEVLRHIPFKKVIMQKASLSNACNAGMGTIGIAYCMKQ